MRWHHKALIGAAGGLSLVLLKLIEVRFLISEPSAPTIIAAYLTFAAYILLGVFVAVFFTDDTLEESKRQKNAFVAGLLAPSVLLAVVSQGPASRAPTESPKIPKISELFISSAHAQETKTPNRVPAMDLSSQVVVVKRSDVGAGFIDGFKIAIGRYTAARPSLYVLGEAQNEIKAAEFANQVNAVLRAKSYPVGAYANVIQPAGENKWFVSIGKPSDKTDVEALKGSMNSAAIATLTAGSVTPIEKKVASSLLEGQVIRASAIFGN